MKSVLSTVVTLTALSTCSSAGEHLEPSVQRHVGVLPLNICQQLIDLGEKAGFLVQEESIDKREQKDSEQKYIPSQTIDVFDDQVKGQEPVIEAPDIWALLQPWIPKLAQIVKDNRNWEGFRKFYPNDPDREPKLDWIFFRKYSPDDERNSLKTHNDDNMNTVNIELSSDYEGGGLFYIKPLASTGEIDDKYHVYGYDMIDSVKRENTSDFVFPNLQAGDAVFYNYTVIHGVAPIESGTRYSMAFFFDMDNPAVRLDEDEDDEEEILMEEEFEVAIRNELTNLKLDIFLVHDADGAREDKEKMYSSVRPREVVHYISLEGDLLQAVISGTDHVVSEIYAKPDKPSFIISQEDVDTLPLNIRNATYEFDDEGDEWEDEEFEVKLHNGLDKNVDILLVYDEAEGKAVKERVFGKVHPNRTSVYVGIEGDVLQAVVSGTGEFVSKIEIDRSQSLYTVSNIANDYLGSEL